MGFFGGPSGKEKEAYKAASDTAQDRFGDIYSGAMGGANRWGTRSWDQATGVDKERAFMWNQLWGPEGNFNPATGGGGGGGGFKGDPNSIWGTLRDTGDLTGGDWEKSRGVYTDFADTGGWNEDQKRDFRGRAIAGTDMYDPRAEAGTRVQGGWGAPTSGNELARQKAIAEMRRTGSFDAETELSRSEREGRKWGASSLEGLGGRVQEGRISGQQALDKERAQKRAHASARAGRAAADRDKQWGRAMGLMNMGYGNVGLTGGDLPYYSAAGSAASGGFGAADTTMGRNQANKGWGSQLAGMAGKAAGAASGLGWSPLG